MKYLFKKVINPIVFFISQGPFVGIFLLICTCFSLLLSNINGTSWYNNFWNYKFIYKPLLYLPASPVQWINDFFMSFFFLFAGMEIKRELLVGELAGTKKAIMPFGAALGGIIMPAIIYSCFNISSSFSNGWGIPTATDIAFSLGIASIFGKRIPPSFKIFLLAIAIIDDLGAIIIIAFFYGNPIKWIFLLAAVIVLSSILILNYFKISSLVLKIILCFIFWYFMFNSGIEASISGAIIAFTIPVNSLPQFENIINKFVNFIVLPLFVLANTAITIPPDILNSLKNSFSIGIIAGLVIGKPLGIFVFSKCLISLKIGSLPRNINPLQLLGIGSLAGIGFTMSVFIANLAFHNKVDVDIAKISIFVSLLLSLIISCIYFLFIDKRVAKLFCKMIIENIDKRF